MRNKHLELRRRIEDAKLAITDAELFGSPLYGAVLSDVAQAATHRYRRRCRVMTYWDEDPGATVAATDNRTIKINAANRLTASFPTRKLKDLSLRGLLGHEIGHILYSDFNMMSVYNAKLLAGEFYPAEPAGLNAEEADSLAELRPLMASRDRATLLTLLKAGNEIDNILEDVYIETRISEAFPGTFAKGIQLNNLRFAETMPTVADQIDKAHSGYSIIANLMIQYCKTGDVNNLTREDSEYLDVLYDCLPVIDAALYDDDGRVRFDAANRLLIHLWPYLKELRDKIAKEAATESELAETLDKTLAEELASLSAAPSGKGKPIPGKREKTLTPEELEELRKTALDVLAEEGGRIALTETESISTGEGGIVTVDHTYAGAGYDKAAADIERVLGKLAETRVCAEAEADLAHELQDFSDRIRYGDAHKGVNIEIDRIAEVPEKLMEQYDRVAPPLLKISRRLQKQVRQVLQDQRRGGRETGLLIGRRRLTRSVDHDDGRYFYKNRLPQELPELAVALLVDESGSMSCADRITKARAASIIVYDFCQCLGIPILVLGHTEIGTTVHIYSYAEFEARDANDRYRLMDMAARSDNRDGAALRFAAERLLRRPEEVKLLLTISDGQPCATDYYGTEAEADLRGIQREMTNRGVTMFAAAIGEDKHSIERIYGKGFLDISNLDDLPVSLTRLIASKIRRR